MIQGSEEWFAARCGHATASRFKDILAKIKSGEAASRRNYRAQLVAERMTGKPAESFSNAAMEWGTAQEPYARMQYEALRGALVEETGFIHHQTIEFCGASPDGLVGADGLVEFKCPNTATHIETVLSGMSPDHMPQVQGQLWITGRQWCDFVSFDPRMPENLQVFIHRVERDDAYIKALEVAVVEFLSGVADTIKQLTKRAA